LGGEGVDLGRQQALAVEHALQPLIAFDHNRLEKRDETRSESRAFRSGGHAEESPRGDVAW